QQTAARRTARAALPGGPLGGRRAGSLVLSLDGGHDRGCSRFDASRKVARSKPRQDLLFLDSARRDVGQDSFEPVADLDAHFLVFDEHEEDDPVVFTLLSDTPFLRRADGEILEREPIENATVYPDEDLIVRLPLELLEPGVQRLGAIRREH